MAITFTQEPELIASVESPIVFKAGSDAYLEHLHFKGKLNLKPAWADSEDIVFKYGDPRAFLGASRVVINHPRDTDPRNFEGLKSAFSMFQAFGSDSAGDLYYGVKKLISEGPKSSQGFEPLAKDYSIELAKNAILFTALKPGPLYDLDTSVNSRLSVLVQGRDKKIRDGWKLLVNLFFREEGEVNFRSIYESSHKDNFALDFADLLNKELTSALAKSSSSHLTRSQINGEYFCQVSEIYGTPPTTQLTVRSVTKKVTKQLLTQGTPTNSTPTTFQNKEPELIAEPNSLSFSGNEMIFKIKSWMYLDTPGTIFVGHLSALKLFPVGTKICFQFSDERVEMVAAANPDQSGNQFLADGTPPYPNATQLAPYFRANYTLNKYYNIEAKDSIIIFTARKTGVFFNWGPDPFLTIHKLGVDTRERENFRFLFELFFRKQGEDEFKTIYSEQIAQDTPFSGMATIDVSKNLDAMLEYSVPFANKSLMTCINSRGEYFCRFAEIYGTKPRIHKVSDSVIKHVIKGGLSYAGFKTKKLLNILLPKDQEPSKDIFLKQGPRVIQVRREQPEYLSFINPRGATEKLYLQIQMIHTDNSISWTWLGGNTVSHYEKIVFNIGYTDLKLDRFATSKNIKEYKVWLINHTDAIVSETITYRIVEEASDHIRYFVYSSSFGTLDTLVTNGRGTQEYELSGQNGTKPQEMDYDLANGNRIDYNLKLQRTFTATTGWLEKPQFDALADFFVAEKKWVVKNGVPLPITVTNKKAGEYHDNKPLIAQAFEYRYNFDDSKYTEGD